MGDPQTGENNTEEVFPLLWRFWTPCQNSQPGNTTKGLGSPQGIWPWRPVRFDYRTSTGLREMETPVLKGTNKILRAPRPRGKEQWLHRRLNQNYMLVLEGLLWRHGLAGASHRDRDTGSNRPEKSPLVSPHRACRPQSCIAAGQTTTGVGAQPHLLADNRIKALLIKALPTRARAVILMPVPPIRKFTQTSSPPPSEGRQKKQEKAQSHSG